MFTDPQLDDTGGAHTAEIPHRRAIIDIGSNTVRLVVYAGPPRAPSVLLNEKVSAKLGKDLDRTGQISDKAMGVALAGLARYAALLRMLGIEDVQTVATAASRDAANGPQFLDAVRALGLAPRLLSGEEEARTSALGVIGAFPGAQGIVADLGGGSLELVAIDGATCEHGISLPFGSLRLPGMRAGGEGRFAAQVARALRGADWCGAGSMPMFLVGGSWRAFARYALHLEAQAHASPLDDPHGLALAPEAALRIAHALSHGKAPDPVAGISNSRLASLPDAAALLAELIRRLEPSQLVFSSWGLREGLLYDTLPPAVRAQDPLLAGVAAFAACYGVSSAAAGTIADWTAPLVAPADERTAALRLAATMLTLAALRTEPNLRTEEALGWALRKRWIGLDSRGRAQLAAAIVGNSGRRELPADIAGLAPGADLREALTWGLAIRFCRRLSGGAAPALAASGVAIRAGRLVLSLDAAAAPLYTDAAAKDLGLLAGWLGLDPGVEKLTQADVPDAA